jgi:hypothetical protein
LLFPHIDGDFGARCLQPYSAEKINNGFRGVERTLTAIKEVGGLAKSADGIWDNVPRNSS